MEPSAPAHRWVNVEWVGRNGRPHQLTLVGHRRPTSAQVARFLEGLMDRLMVSLLSEDEDTDSREARIQVCADRLFETLDGRRSAGGHVTAEAVARVIAEEVERLREVVLG